MGVVVVEWVVLSRSIRRWRIEKNARFLPGGRRIGCFEVTAAIELVRKFLFVYEECVHEPNTLSERTP